MQPINPSTTTELPRVSSATRSLLFELAAGAALGMVVLYGVGFA